MAACTALKLGWELFSGSATYRTLHNVHSRDKLLWHACYTCWGTIMSKPFIDRKCLLAEGINIYWLAVQKKHLIPQQKFWKDKKFQHCAVADPGFSPGGCANSQNCYYFSNFCQKLHENERIWTPGGGAPLTPPLDPPMLCCKYQLQSNKAAPIYRIYSSFRDPYFLWKSLLCEKDYFKCSSFSRVDNCSHNFNCWHQMITWIGLKIYG